MQPSWQKMAADRYEELDKGQRERRLEENQLKFHSTLQHAFQQQSNTSARRIGMGSGAGICYRWDGRSCQYGNDCKFRDSHIRGVNNTTARPGQAQFRGGSNQAPQSQYGNHPRIEEH
ncbi:TPA: hypothetical protein ACH3X2_002618 [Trebouxia sp. C0005]